MTMIDEKRLLGGKFRCTLQPSNELALPSDANWNLVIHLQFQYETNDGDKSYAKGTIDRRSAKQQHDLYKYRSIPELSQELLLDLLQKGFEKQELLSFCLTHDEFYDLHETLDKSESAVPQVANKIVHRAKQKNLLKTVDGWAKRKNPGKYSEYARKMSTRRYEIDY